MNLNATLVVQMINFFLAYWIMRIFLFKPALQVAQEEQAEQQRLNIIIKQQEQSMEIKENERQKHWQMCRDYFQDNQPPIDSKKLISSNVSEVSVPKVSQKLIDEIADEAQQVLVQKIGYIGE